MAVSHPTSGTAGPSFVGRNVPGMAQLLIDRDRDVVVGATFTGYEVAPAIRRSSASASR